MQPPAPSEDDDSDPYQVHSDGPPTEPCPDCRKPVPVGAAVCTFCGLNLTSGAKAVRTFEPMCREWEWGWPLGRRLILFLVLQAVNGLAVVSGILAGWSIPGMLAMGLIFAAVQAFLLGTYDRITLKQNEQGKVRLTRTWRVCFFEREPRRIELRGNEGIALRRSHEGSFLDWWMALVLLPYFVVPAVLWYIYVISPDRISVAFLKDHGSTGEVVYRGLNEAHARDMAEALRDASGMVLHDGI